MDINLITSTKLDEIHSQNLYDVIDVPGQGFFKTKIAETLINAKLILVFLDSNDKPNISHAAEYLYDILNNENFDEFCNIIIVCNKQDLKFSRNKKIIESELTSEIESIKQIKQKNNLEDISTLGNLSNLKTKFKFDLYKNIQFVETDKNSKFESVIKTLKDNLL